MVNQVDCTFANGNIPRCPNTGEELKKKIGSFRDGGTSSQECIQELFLECDGNPKLGKEIFDALFLEDDNDLEIADLITNREKDSPVAYLNNGAFGRAYDASLKLSIQLRLFAEENPDLFYDQLLMPLLKHSYSICSDFFGLTNDENCLLVPNCTMGMKAVMDKLLIPKPGHIFKGTKTKLLNQDKMINVGYLSPIYGATQNLLKSYQMDYPSRINVVDIVPKNFLFQEDPDEILKAIDQAVVDHGLSILMCDEIASQTGRILPLLQIAEYCEKKNIILVVDGTQSFDFESSKLAKIDYWIMSTHKWMANVKTCGVILWREGLVDFPNPPAVSFGYFNESVRDKFLWTGMMDTYISYIVLAKTLKMQQKYGKRQIQHGSDLLHEGMKSVLQVQPLLEIKDQKHQQKRLMNVFELKNVNERWRGLVRKDKEGDVKKANITANDIQTVLERIYGIHVSVKDFRGGDGSCGQTVDEVCQRNQNVTFYIRISAFSYNTLNDFQRLANVLFGNTSLTDHIKRNKNQLNLLSSTVRKPLSKLQQVIKNQFLLSFDRYETLFDALKTKALFIRAEKLRHHLIFYFGHTAVFYINKLISGAFLPATERVDPHFESVFAIGVDEMTWDDTLTENYDWCGFLDDENKLEEYYHRVKEYRKKVRNLVVKLIEENDIQNLEASNNTLSNEGTSLNNVKSSTNIKFADKIPQDSIFWIFLMGIEHENIHLETSCSIISDVPLNLIKRHHSWNYGLYPYDTKEERIMNTAVAKTLEKYLKGEHDDYINGKEFPTFNPTTNFNGDNDAPPPPLPHLLLHNRLLPVLGGAIKLGKDHVEQDFYGWDNEYGSETHTINDFEVSETLVSNAEFLMFMKKGMGYNNPTWWSEEGWRYVTERKITMPRLWRKEKVDLKTDFSVDGEEYYYRTLLKEIPLQWSWPVEVNNLEAEAFCNWKSNVTGKPIRMLSHEEQFLIRERTEENTSNVNLNNYCSPSSVYHHHGYLGKERMKLFDIYGNVWRHSVSVLTVLNGFKVHPVYEDFTLPTIDGKHNHILGGSYVSIGNCANLNARLGFRRHFHQFAGIRYVCSPNNNNYHKTVPHIFDNIMMGKEITEHYTQFENDSLPLVMEKVPNIKNWPAKFGQLAAAQINKMHSDHSGEVEKSKSKVLVAYGSAGRVTLELVRNCKSLTIDHTDPTANTLQVLDQLLQHQKLQWYQQLEGDINELLEYRLDEDNSAKLLDDKQNEINFKQIFDYTNIKSNFDGYNVIVADIRFSSAQTQISHLAERIVVGGVLILGTIDEPSKLKEDVLKDFDLVEQGSNSYPHIFRETINKNQYSISYFSCWRKVKDASDGNDTKGNIKTGASTDHTIATTTYYEDNSILESYEKFHFGLSEIGVKNFPLAVAEFCIEMADKFEINFQAAMDAGCGPGRTAMELCNKFDKVEAFDYSQNFIDSLHRHKETFLKTPDLISKITAYQGDAHEMEANAHQKEFDLILGCNLIDRLHSPEVWINQTKKMSKGLVVICSPYTWKDIHTAKEKWVGGKCVNGEKYLTMDGLKDLMQPQFSLVHHQKIVFSIPDSDGTFQYTASNCTVFLRQK